MSATPVGSAHRQAETTKLPAKRGGDAVGLVNEAEDAAPIGAGAAGSTGPLKITKTEVAIMEQVYQTQQAQLAAQVNGAPELPDPLMYVVCQGAGSVLDKSAGALTLPGRVNVTFVLHSAKGPPTAFSSGGPASQAADIRTPPAPATTQPTRTQGRPRAARRGAHRGGLHP